MTYIKTKDGRIIKNENVRIICDKLPNILVETRFPLNDDEETNCDGMVEVKTEISIYSTSIDSLCDEFDWKWNEKKFPYSSVRQHDRYGGWGDLKRAIRYEENYGNYLNQDYEIFGAIWAEWGLKYVAKMNDKGELELL